MPAKRHRTLLLLALFFSTLVFHMVVGWQDISILARNGFLCDDSFYAFQIAKNIAAGNGPTFDGVLPTTGFQPLYVFILVPVFWLFGTSLVVPVKIALMISAVFIAMAAVVLFLITSRYVRESIALVVSPLWAFSPVVIRQGANGLETSLALLLFSVSVYYYLANVRGDPYPSRNSMIVLGILLGLTIFARIDELFLLFAVLLDYLFVLRKRGASRGAIAGVGYLLAGVCFASSPWVLYYAVQAGTPVFDSGAAIRFLSMAYAPFFDVQAPAGAAAGPGVSFILFNVVHSFSVLKAAPPVHALYRLMEKAGSGAWLETALDILGTIAGLVLVGVLVYYFIQSRRGARFNRRSEVNFLLVFSLLLIGAYSFVVFGFFFFIRYYFPIYFILCIYCAFLLEDCCGRFFARARSSVVRAAVFSCAGAYVIAFALMAYSQSFRTKKVYCFYDVAKWAEKHTGEHDTIGAFQGGAIGYFSGRRVVNLDGKVNHDALEALKSGTLHAYLHKAGVDVVLDKCNVLELFLLNPGGTAPETLHLARITDADDPCMPGWVAYRVLEEGGNGGSIHPSLMRR
ncbi:MAG: glycosyltransferase family 39 protein [Chitinivibrionia bacterium]|nr:glycosyltransferase family 39 protein [Chitinivibrionia bacterium]